MIKIHNPRNNASKMHGQNSGERDRSNIYGRKWKELRLFVLRRQPLCVSCKKEGVITEAREVDHIQPHAGNMELFYDLENLQALCKPCHSRKTMSENNGGFISATMIPAWLPKTIKPLTVVCGRPMAGMAEYVAEKRGSNDLVVDLEVLAFNEGKNIFELSKPERNGLIRKRNEILAKFMRGETRHDNGWLVVTAGRPEYREFWQSKGAEVLVINTPSDVCQRRINQMDLPVKSKISLLQAAQDWK